MPDDVFEAFRRAASERAASEPSLGAKLRALRLASGDDRRAKLEALAEAGATEGERAAARAALDRFDRTPSHAEHDRMQRGGNWIEP